MLFGKFHFMSKKFREISLYVKINFILCDNYSHKSLIISIEEFHFMRKPTVVFFVVRCLWKINIIFPLPNYEP